MADAPSPASVQPRHTGPDGDRAAHLEWAKQRAREYLDAGDAVSAWTSFVSDLRKHDGLAQHAGIELGTMLALGGFLSTPREVREHIEGCR